MWYNDWVYTREYVLYEKQEKLTNAEIVCYILKNAEKILANYYTTYCYY